MNDRFTKVTPALLEDAFGTELVEAIDDARDIPSQLGLRRYTVKIVRMRWSGGRRGSGAEMIDSETLLEPTPKLMDLSGVTEILQESGLEEIGSVMITKISGRYSEEILRGLDVNGSPVDDATSLFYEIQFIYPNAAPGAKRRFTLRGVPEYSPTKVGWTVRLERAHPDRARG